MAGRDIGMIVLRLAASRIGASAFVPTASVLELASLIRREAHFATSKDYVAMVSDNARTRALIISTGTIVRTGNINAPASMRIKSAVVSDSGRVFVQGAWRGEARHQHDSPLSSRYPIFEINRGSGALERMNTLAALPSNAVGLMLGSEHNNLVLRVAGPEVPVHMKWVAAE